MEIQIALMVQMRELQVRGFLLIIFIVKIIYFAFTLSNFLIFVQWNVIHLTIVVIEVILDVEADAYQKSGLKMANKIVKMAQMKEVPLILLNS